MLDKRPIPGGGQGRRGGILGLDEPASAIDPVQEWGYDKSGSK